MRSKFKWIFTLLVAFMMQFSFAQEKTVTGVVTDELGPVVGANVVVKGTTNATTTDFDGKYSIKAKSGDVLEISFLESKKSISVGAATNYNVELKQELKEVVITAYGIARETKKLAYATQKVQAKELMQAAPVNPVTALAGKVSGLNIITKNNGVNPSTSIILRGYKGITGDNSALIVIDGIIQSGTALNSLSPNDIESINVLKGASATALYGSQGRNGALIVTTKQGSKETGLSVEFNSSYTVEKIKYFPELQTTFGPGFNNEYDPYENTSWGPRFDGVPRRVGPILNDGSYQLLPYQAIPDNRKDFFVDGITKINTIALSGGDEKSTFYFSAQRSDVTGITPKDEYVKNNFRLNASRTSGKFKISTGVSFFTDKSNVAGDGGYQTRPLYWSIINTPANIPLTSYKDWRNNKFATPEGYFNEYYQNPYMLIDIARNEATSNRLFSNVKFNYEFTKWFSAAYSLSGTFFNSYARNTRDAVTYNPVLAPTRTDANTVASVAEGTSTNTRITSDLVLTFKRELFKDVKGTLILGNALYTYKENNLNVGGNDLFVPGLYNPSVRTGELTGGSSVFQERRVGNFADLTLDISTFLSLNGAYRLDRSSTLKDSYDFYTYGASLSMLDALPSIKGDIMSFWKINGSYSKTGFAPSIGFINETYATPAGFPFGEIVGLAAPTNGASATFSPSFTKSYEFGTELGMFNNRLNIKANYFNTTTDNEFLTSSTSYASGLAALRLNSGSMESKGIELDVNGSIIRNDNFEWKLGVNLSKIKSEVLSLSDGADRLQTGLATSEVGIFAQVGESFPSLYGTAYTRDAEGHIMLNADGDPIVSSELKFLGNTTPDLIMGFNTSVRYKQFTLSAVADYKTGHKYYNNLVDALEFTGSTQHSASAGREPFVFPNSVYEYTPGVWSENTNITTSNGGFDFWTGTYNAIKENYVVDATTLKLREVALSYELPSKYLDKTFIKGVTLGFVARNIIMLRSAQNKYTDPEFTNDSQQVTGFGTQSQLPPTASYGFKLDVKF